MNGELFGVKNFPLENDGLIHDAVIEKCDFNVRDSGEITNEGV